MGKEKYFQDKRKIAYLCICENNSVERENLMMREGKRNTARTMSFSRLHRRRSESEEYKVIMDMSFHKGSSVEGS